MTESASEVLGRPSTWPDMPDVKAKIEKYQRIMETHFEGERVHPWNKDLPIVRSRIKILDLKGTNIECQSNQPGNPSTTWHQLEDTIKKAASTENSRHVIFLEGMDPRLIEVLGVQLSIPPGFWVSHCIGNKARVFDTSMTRLEGSTYWKVKFPQRFWLDEDIKDIKDGEYDIHFGNCCRGFEDLGDEEFSEKTFAVASLWSRRIAKNSWIFLVLVDAPYGYIVPRFEPPKGFTNPAFKLVTPNSVQRYNYFDLMLNESSYTTKRLFPLLTPIWDLLVEAHKEGDIPSLQDPFSSTSTIRKVIYLVWQARMAQERRDWNVIWMGSDIHLLDEMDPRKPKNMLEMSKKMSIGHRNMTVRRFYLEFRLEMIQEIIEAFGHGESHSLSPIYQSGVSDDTRRWKAIYDWYSWMDKTLESNMTMYARFAAMTEAFTSKLQAFEAIRQTEAANRQANSANQQAYAANRLARSAGQLAKIATVAVPCTVAASIFSMNGEFAAGERLFFVYWCVAIPSTLGLLFWILQRDIIALLTKTSGEMRSTGVTTGSGSLLSSYSEV